MGVSPGEPCHADIDDGFSPGIESCHVDIDDIDGGFEVDDGLKLRLRLLSMLTTILMPMLKIMTPLPGQCRAAAPAQ